MIATIVAWFISNPTIIAILAAVVGALGWGFNQRLAGAKAERAKQAGKDRAAIEDRLEMHRDASDIEKRVHGMSDPELDAEVAKWSKPRS